MRPTSSHTSCDALVVGAGPVGLTMALELTRHGLRPRIVDRNPLASDKSKALVLWCRTLELLDDMGIAGDFVAAGKFMRGANIYGNGRRLVQIRLQRDDTAYPQPLTLPQSQTERLLTEHLRRRRVHVQRPVELIELADLGDHVEATLVSGDGSEEHVQTAWLLGCDGAHSTVRKHLRIEFAGECEANDWILADVRIEEGIAPDEMSIFWHADGIAAFFPIDRQRFRVVADAGKAASTEKPADPTLAEVQAIVERRVPGGLRLHDAVWLAGFRIQERKVNEYGRGRIFLAGDAAHIHSPAGGQGMNTGMQDAYNLGWKLGLVQRGQGRASPLLESYTIERSPVGDMVLRNAGSLTRLATVRNPVLQFLRNRVAALVGRLSFVQRRVVAALTEMAVHYPASPLNGDAAGDAWGSNVRAGDRLPDATLRDPRTGQPVRLLEAMRGTQHGLLLLPTAGNAEQAAALVEQARRALEGYGALVRRMVIVPQGGDAKPPAENEGILVDVGGEVRGRLGLRGSGMVLVRPDGYVGFRGHAGAGEELRKHLERYLIA